MENYFNIKDTGVVADGRNDCSEILQKAIDSTADKGGTVFLPAGIYLMKSGVVVPMGVNIEGETHAATGPWQNWLDGQDKGKPDLGNIQLDVAGKKWISKEIFKGTWIIADHGAGDVNSPPTFRLEGNSSIKKIGFVHAKLPPVTENVVKCPPAIGSYSTNDILARDGVTVEDITLANPYYGIVFAIGEDIESDYLNVPESDVAKSFGRHRIHNIMGGALHTGILIKGLLDTIDFQNIQFNYTNYESGYVKYRMQNATDIHFIRADGMNISNYLSFGAYRGIYTQPGYASKNVSFRATNINVESMVPLSFNANGMYEISNSYFLMVNFANLNTNEVSRCLEISSDPDCPHQSEYLFSNCFFQNSIPCSIRENAGKVDNVDDTVIEINFTASHHASFSNCMFWGWGAYNKKTPVIKYNHTVGGIPTCNFSDCTFNSESFKGILAKTGGDKCESGELVFSNARLPYSLEILDDKKIWYKSCQIAKESGKRIFFERITE